MNYTIDEAQELRKQGFIIVVNLKLTKVLLVTKDEDEAYKYKLEQRKKGVIVKVFMKLNRCHISRSEMDEALENLKSGLNCR